LARLKRILAQRASKQLIAQPHLVSADHIGLAVVGDLHHVGERTEKELITAFCGKIAELSPRLVTAPVDDGAFARRAGERFTSGG